MSQNSNDLEKKMSNISIGSLSSCLSNEDYKSAFYLITTSRPEQITGHVKEILGTLKTESNIYKFINSVVDILKVDQNYWKSIDNIKTLFNEMDEVHLSLFSTNKSDSKVIQQKYNGYLENIFTNYLNEVNLQIQKYINTMQDANFYQLTTILLNFTQVLDIKNFEPILYPMAKFAENLFIQYNTYVQLQPLIIEFVLHINHRLVNYLAVIPGNPVSKGLKESISIYTTVRNNIVSLIYTHPEIITKALSILEHRSRFFGLTADAIPENENHGDYIVVDPLNTAFEDDDVYDDYERFLANLPNQ